MPQACSHRESGACTECLRAVLAKLPESYIPDAMLPVARVQACEHASAGACAQCYADLLADLAEWTAPIPPMRQTLPVSDFFDTLEPEPGSRSH